MPVGAAPRRDRAVLWPPGSLRFARSRRGGARTVFLAVALNDGLNVGTFVGGPGGWFVGSAEAESRGRHSLGFRP
jgi:hypothetical protein